MTEILFKSKIISDIKYNLPIFIFCSLLTLIFFIHFFIQLISSLVEDIYYHLAQIGVTIFLTLFLFFFWLGFQFYGSYLIIQDDGIKIKKPYRFFRHKFIPWNSIKGVLFTDRGITWLTGMRSINFNTIEIFFKNNKKSVELSNIWVNPIREAYKWLEKYIDPLYISENCEFHPHIEASSQCLKCGRSVCSDCIEEKSIGGTNYCECSLCLFDKMNGRIRTVSIISLIFPIIMLIDYISGFFIPPLIYLTRQLNVSIAIPFLVALIILPYGYGLYFANLKRLSILRKLKIEFNKQSFILVSCLTIATSVSYSLFFLILINIFSLLGFLIYTGIYALIICKFEYPKKNSNEL